MRDETKLTLGLWVLLVLGLLAAGLFVTFGYALTNSSATITWNKTTDATIRYEIRWSNWLIPTWTTVAINLDSTTGQYLQTWPAFPDSTGDRWACWDLRAVQGVLASKWLSELGEQRCTQIPLAVAPTPIPVPVPTPIPLPPATVTMDATKVYVICDPTRFKHAKTTGTGNTRTIQCLP